MDLTDEQLRRYARQVILPEIGPAGQKKICAGSVLCIGAGGLGSPVLLYLAAAGVGKLGVVDFDTVDLPNMHRQVIHTPGDIGRPKTISAAEKLQKINPTIQLMVHQTRLTNVNALDIISQFDVVVDGSDNLPTRYLTNDACVLLKKPLVYGAVFRFEGQASVFAPHLDGPCYRCVYSEPPPQGAIPSCAEAGVLGVLPGIIGCIQAAEALKLLIGEGELLIGRLVVVDTRSMRFRELKLRRDPACPICGTNPTIRQLIDYDQFCGGTAGPAQTEPCEDEVSVDELYRALTNPALGIKVIDVRAPAEHAIAHVPGAVLIPLDELPQRLNELDKNITTYLLCKTGVRSLYAVALLKRHGFKCVKSVRGGLDAWRTELDLRTPKC